MSDTRTLGIAVWNYTFSSQKAVALFIPWKIVEGYNKKKWSIGMKADIYICIPVPLSQHRVSVIQKRQDAFEVWGIYIEIFIKPNEVTLARSMKGNKKGNIQKRIYKTEIYRKRKGLKVYSSIVLYFDCQLCLLEDILLWFQSKRPRIKTHFVAIQKLKCI